jgi:DNA-directed RNA polymerase specialized sigma24 family protein
MWDGEAAYGVKAETFPEPGMPKAQSDVSHGNSIFAMLADVRDAWRDADLSLAGRQCVLLRYGLDWEYAEIGAARGVRKQSAQEATERAVGKLTAHLNGEQYIDGYDTEVQPDPM